MLTFGLAGRLACTFLLLAVPVGFVLYAGPLGLAAALIWTGWLLPRALRDTWRRAALPSTELTRLRENTARELAEPPRVAGSHPVFDPERRFPTRW